MWSLGQGGASDKQVKFLASLMVEAGYTDADEYTGCTLFSGTESKAIDRVKKEIVNRKDREMDQAIEDGFTIDYS